jgi:hypothetical protein
MAWGGGGLEKSELKTYTHYSLPKIYMSFIKNESEK